MDGEITIGTRLDTDKFDRQISQLERKIVREEERKLVLNSKIEIQEEEFETARQKADELADAYQRLEQLQKIIASGKATPEQFTMAQELQGTYGSLEQLEVAFLKALNKQDAINAKAYEMRTKYQEINNKVDEYKQKIESVKMQKQVADVDKLKASFNGVGSSIQGAVKHVTRLALGIFGARSAFMALRRASSDLANYDQQYGANLEYIRYALTQMIAPVLQWIVRLAATLLGYINAIVQAWFGINLFARGSAESFNKMKAGASGASKAVKEIKKQLAGFDEINMLTDQSDTGTKAGGGGIVTPNFDLSSMQAEPPKWLKWIVDNKELISGALAGIAAGLIALNFGLSPLKSLGIGLIVAGIVSSIQDIVKFIKDPSWGNFANILRDLAILLAGVAVIMLAINSANPVGWILLAIAAVISLTATIIKYWETIKAFLQGAMDWLKGKSDWVHQMFGDLIGSIYDYFVSRFQAILNFANGLFSSLKQIFDGFIKFFKGVFTGNWELAFEGLKQIVSGFVNNIINVFNYVMSFLRDKVALWGNVVGKAFGGAFKSVVNAVLRTIENTLNTPIRAINRLIDVINAVPGINLGKLTTFNLPRLKTGAIINMPNRGTLVGGGSAIAGEAGREGILPLDDRQAMAELGAEIGRHVLINLTNITQMNGRVIGRELKQVQSEQEFAFNN